MRPHDPRALRALLAALAPLGLAACGSPLGEFSESVCLLEEGGLSSLEPVAGTDFVALREATEVWDGGEEPNATSRLVSSWGTRCASASDPASCLAAADALPFAEALTTRGGGFGVPRAYDLVVTGGDEVFAVSDRAGLLELLGPIDAPSEAALVAFAAGHRMPCKEANVREEDGRFVLKGTRGSTCGSSGIEHYELFVSSSGDVSEGDSELVEEGDPNCVVGRRPSALRARPRMPRSAGAFFANAARLEAASVHAFEELALELALHRAPARLVGAALRARRDEVRHARITARLARRFGGRPSLPRVGRRPARPLGEVALDNAAEGCVRETFGALVATVQSMRSRDPDVRRVLRRIAADETRHAALSFAIDAWAQDSLGARASRAMADARRAAVLELRRDVARVWPQDVLVLAGMPDAEASARLLRGLEAALWA